MKIVIDIPEELVSELDDDDYERVMSWYETTLYCAIKEGTPLPKGHGRLIDYSWVVDNVIKKLRIKDKRYLLEAEKALMSIVESAPTIIEAESEEEE